MAESKPIQFGIKEIKELEFFVDEAKEIDGAVDFNYNVDISPDLNKELLRIIITASHIKASSKEIFLRGKISTAFSIKDMKTHTKKNQDGSEGFNISEAVWATFFSIAFTHARAILARSSAGTKFSHLLLPVINPQHEFKKLFGKYLETQEG
jgi:hypothetical protein